MKKLWRTLDIGITVIFLLLIVGIGGLTFAERHQANGTPQLGKYFVATVMSGSMSPTFNAGDVAIDVAPSRQAAEHLHPGQIVTFRTGSDLNGQPLLITHRIVGVMTIKSQSGQVTRLYQTKGDANKSPDPGFLRPRQIVGLYQGRIPYAGYLVVFLHRPLGFALIVLVPALYLIGEQFLRLWRAIDEEERQKRLAREGGEETAKG